MKFEPVADIAFVGFSPAWQQVYCVETYEPGSVIRVEQAFHYSSGKATNAAIVASQFSTRIHLLTVSGGDLKQLFESDLYGHRLVPTFYRIPQTRVCTTICPANGQSTEFVENAGPISASLADEIVADLTNEPRTAIACCGSVPEGLPRDIYARLLRTTTGPTIVDAVGEVLLNALPAEPTLVKPNRAELAATLGVQHSDRIRSDNSALLDGMKRLRDQGAQAVLVTDGAKPAHLLVGNDYSEIAPPSITRLVNPIGAGDALTGAALVALAEGADVVTAVHKGLEAAARKCERLKPEV